MCVCVCVCVFLTIFKIIFKHCSERYEAGSVESDRALTPLADGFYACVWSIMGDLDYYAKTLGLPRSTSHNPCPLCKCTLHGSTSWKDNSTSAEWPDTCWTPSEWLLWPNKSPCKLFTAIGVTACSVALDYMHSKYLGSDQYQFGSILYLLCFIMMPLSPKENLAECWAFIKAYYVAHRTKHRYAAIEKVSMFVRKKGGPKLRGKAGEVKGLGPAMLALWESKMNAMLETHKQIRLMLLLNVKMESLLELHHDEFKLPESASKQFIQYGFGMAQCQTVLAQHYENEEVGKTLFASTAKIHMVLHAALTSGALNPALVWCFVGEDFMRKVQKLGESCVRGVTPPQALNKMVSHYRLAMHLQFSSH